MRNYRAKHPSQPRPCLWTPRPAWAITCHSSKRGVLATRKPMLLLRLSGSLLLRFDERQLLELLFQLPPRSTRSKSLSKQSRAHFSASSRCGFECHHAIYETPLKKLEALPAARPTPAATRVRNRRRNPPSTRSMLARACHSCWRLSPKTRKSSQ